MNARDTHIRNALYPTQECEIKLQMISLQKNFLFSARNACNDAYAKYKNI